MNGFGQGMFLAITWGLDTVLAGVLLSLVPFIGNKEAIFLAPFVSVFLYDLFSSLWIMIYLTFKGEIGRFFLKGYKN